MSAVFCRNFKLGNGLLWGFFIALQFLQPLLLAFLLARYLVPVLAICSFYNLFYTVRNKINVIPVSTTTALTSLLEKKQETLGSSLSAGFAVSFSL